MDQRDYEGNMPGKWEVFSRMLGSMKMYIVGRLRDVSEPLHAGNIEYAPDAHFTTDEERAEKHAAKLNQK